MTVVVAEEHHTDSAVAEQPVVGPVVEARHCQAVVAGHHILTDSTLPTPHS